LPFFVSFNRKSLSAFRGSYAIIVADLEGGRTLNWREWFDGLKWPLVLFWACCLLLLLWGGERLYRTHIVIRPAVAKLKQLEGVRAVEFKEKDLYVELEAPNNFKATAEALSTIAADFLGPDSSLFIIDQRNEALEQLFDELSLSLAQAASRGEYETMRPHWTKIAAGAGAEMDVAVSPTAIYISLKKGGDYLYQIIPREDANSYREEDQLPLLPKVLAKEGVQ